MHTHNVAIHDLVQIHCMNIMTVSMIVPCVEHHNINFVLLYVGVPEEFSKKFTPDQLYLWLLLDANQMPEEDCKIIKSMYTCSSMQQTTLSL